MASKKHTKKPTGLSIKRSGKSIVISWTRGETYNGQELRYQLTAGGATTVLSTKNRRLGAATKSVSVVIPSKAGKITVKIKGHTKKRGWSAWTTKTFNITAPPKPSLSASWSEDYENRTIFTWSVNTSSDSPAVFTKIIYETILVKNYNGNINDNFLFWGNIFKPCKGSLCSCADIFTFTYKRCNSYKQSQNREIKKSLHFRKMSVV